MDLRGKNPSGGMGIKPELPVGLFDFICGVLFCFLAKDFLTGAYQSSKTFYFIKYTNCLPCSNICFEII